MKFLEFEARITKSMKQIIIPRQKKANYEIHRISRQNHENHTNLIIPRQNYENHEIRRIQCQNNENH